MSLRYTNRTRLLGSGWSARVAQWVQRSQIKSIQRGSITITGATSNTATVTTVATGNARLRMLGSTYNVGAGAPNVGLVRIALTNATTITATVNTSPGADTVTVSWELTEYQPGVIKSVQRGTIAIGAGTATITAVDTTKTEVDFLGQTDTTAIGSEASHGQVVLTNATTVTYTVGAAIAQVGGYQVVEFF